MDVIVIGGGAAGLTAAITASRQGAHVTVLEAQDRPAKKILATGGGRCNLGNMNVDCSSYYADTSNSFIKNFLYNFDTTDTLCFFESFSVYPRIREGYIYPLSDEARTVSKTLIYECEKLGVTIRNNTPVVDIEKDGDIFKVSAKDYSYEADKVIIASGGLAMSDTESARRMYNILEGLGHTIKSLKPSLVSIKTDKLSKLSGVKAIAKVSALRDNQDIAATYFGEVHFTKDGLSGIPIMNISRYLEDNTSKLVLDFLPELSEEFLNQELDNTHSLDNFIPEKLAKALKEENLTPKKVILSVVKTNDFDHAQVTRGGICLDEIDDKNMESKLIQGLHFAGEIIDVDGMCGGYNLHFAWGSGVIAGNGATGNIYEHKMPTIDQLRRWEAAEIGTRRGGSIS